MTEEEQKSTSNRLHVLCERLLRVHRGEVQQGLVEGELKAISREVQNLRKLIVNSGCIG
jgi:hypothetical protein